MNFLLDDTGDLAFEDNNWVMATGTEEIRQIVMCNLNSIAGEWFLNTTQGLPYFTQIFEKQSDGQVVNDIFQNAVANSEGILEVISLDATIVDRQNRILLVEFEARTIAGILVFSEQINPVQS